MKSQWNFQLKYYSLFVTTIDNKFCNEIHPEMSALFHTLAISRSFSCVRLKFERIGTWPFAYQSSIVKINWYKLHLIKYKKMHTKQHFKNLFRLNRFSLTSLYLSLSPSPFLSISLSRTWGIPIFIQIQNAWIVKYRILHRTYNRKRDG